MNEESQNALLKNLEEPPEGVIFILMTPFPSMLRETIRSRCWTINFSPLTNAEIKVILVDFFKVESKKAEEVSLFSGGSVTTALDLLDNDFNFLMEKTIIILRYSFGGKFHSALNEINYFLAEDDSASLRLIIQMIIIWLNDLQKNRNNIDTFYFKKFDETLEKFNSKFPDIKLNNITSRLDYYSSLIKNNINLNLLAINIIFELASFANRVK
jgi:DNA polymerase-3 subunit delta'